MEATTWNREDRDLLVELRTEMKGLRSDIRDMKDANKIYQDDYEQRIRALEVQTGEHSALIKIWGGLIATALAVGEIIIKFMH